jgi:Flp pilus assembly protein TadD
MAGYFFGLAIETYPGYMAAIQQKAEVLEMKGQYEDAVRLAIWAKDNVGTDRGQLIMLAQKLAEGGDYDNALVRLKQAVALDPHDAYANAELGRFYVMIGRRDDGIDALQRAYRLNPSEPGVIDLLAELGFAPVEEDAPPLEPRPIHDIKESAKKTQEQMGEGG